MSEVSQSIGELARALAAAQADMSNPTFDAQNPHFRSKFASLAAVRNAVIPVLAKHGICLTQDLRTTETGVSCTTILTHSSGQQMAFGPLVMPVPEPTPQKIGSASTYAKRYAMQAVVAVVGDQDDDAEAAEGRGDSNGGALAPEKRDRYLPEIVERITAEDGMGLRQLWNELKDGEQRGIWSFLSTKQKAAARDLLQKKVDA